MKTIRDNEGSPLQAKECYPGEIQDLYDRIHELESMLAPLMSVRVFSEDALKNFFPVKCAKCGWIGISSSCGGRNALADTGDYNAITCPVCYSDKIDDLDECDITVQKDLAKPDSVSGLITYDELANAFIDAMDGCSEWWIIQSRTGLSPERCMEISKIFCELCSNKRNYK